MNTQEMRDKTAAIRTGKLKMKREGEYWTKADREILKSRFLAGYPMCEIAIELERSEPAVYQQAEQMQLFVKKSRVPKKSCPAAQEPVCLCSVCTLDRSHCPRCEHYLQIQGVE